MKPHISLITLGLSQSRLRGALPGGDPSQSQFPQRFEVDYGRVFQKAVKN